METNKQASLGLDLTCGVTREKHINPKLRAFFCRSHGKQRTSESWIGLDLYGKQMKKHKSKIPSFSQNLWKPTNKRIFDWIDLWGNERKHTNPKLLVFHKFHGIQKTSESFIGLDVLRSKYGQQRKAAKHNCDICAFVCVFEYVIGLDFMCQKMEKTKHRILFMFFSHIIAYSNLYWT